MKVKSIFKLFFVAVLAVSMAGFKGCQSPDKTARDVIASATGAIAQGQGEYKDECNATPGKQECVLINQAVYAQNAAITGLEIYCTWPKAATLPEPGAVCSPVKSAYPALEASVSRLNQLIGQINAIIKAKGKARVTTPGRLWARLPNVPTPSHGQLPLPPQAISLALLGLKLLPDSLLKGKPADYTDETINAVTGAIAELEKHQGKDVTFGELEALRLHTLWPDAGHPAGSTGEEESPTPPASS